MKISEPSVPSRVVGGAIRAFLVLSLAAGLTACGPGSSKSTQLAEAVRAAVSAGPSADAYETLDDVLDGLAVACDRFLTIPSCESPEFVEAKQWAVSELEGMLLAGAKNGEGWAIRRIFGMAPGPFVTKDLRVQVALLILEKAAEQGATPDVLLQAGLFYMGGTFTQQDFGLSKRMLERAWLKGMPRAAGALSELAQLQRDPATAYLWAVRCVGDCMTSQTLESLVEQLEPVQVERIQKIARDAKVLSLADLASRSRVE